MEKNLLFQIPDEVTKENFEEAIHQAITLELATIPTYLSTYYSINRAQDEDTLYKKILGQLPAGSEALAQELTLDILVYANKSAALVMSVVIEEMLHLSLSSNVRQAICQSAPELIAISKVLNFPTQLDGHEPEFPINLGKLSLNQLSTFLQIESPKKFDDPNDTPETDDNVIKYNTIGGFYEMIIQCVKDNFPGPYAPRPQLLPDDSPTQPRPYYSQNSINTVYYDRDHKPQFSSDEDSGALIGVHDGPSAIAAMNEIIEQGEGNSKDNQSLLTFDDLGMPVPLPVVNGKVQFQDGDYDDIDKKELSHFAKFLEIYSLGVHYNEKFMAQSGLDPFFDYFVYDQPNNPKQSEYDTGATPELALMSKLGNALYTYILLMVETCYYKDESTQFNLFMYGIHKSMIWLLSEFGNGINGQSFTRNGVTYAGAVTFENYTFEDQPNVRPKEQMMVLAAELAELDKTNWGWLMTDKSYLIALPDVGMDYSVTPNVPAIPAN